MAVEVSAEPRSERRDVVVERGLGGGPLLERFEVYSYSIGWGVLLQSSAALAAVPQAMVELAFLVNDRPAYVIQTTAPTVTPPGDNKNWVANGSFVSDLVNPMDLGARDRLAIRVGASSLTTLDVGISIVIGTQFVGYGAGAPTLGPFESTISYRVIDVPASRRL